MTNPLARAPEPPETEAGKRLIEGGRDYSGGFGGTCYECRFATAPLDSLGNVAPFEDVANDPTEAFFRCSLPGRDPTVVAWGEYAPCTEQEWIAAHVPMIETEARAGYRIVPESPASVERLAELILPRKMGWYRDEESGSLVTGYLLSPAEIVAIVNQRGAVPESEVGLDARPDIRVLGLTVEEIRRAVAVADLHYPQWREANRELAARLSDRRSEGPSR